MKSKSLNEERKWTTKDGRVLNISDMTTEHIKNTIAMLERKGFVTPKDFSYYFSCVHQGDIAQMEFERELDRVKPCIPLVWLKEELSKREEKRKHSF